jgi:hypothetical protein
MPGGANITCFAQQSRRADASYQLCCLTRQPVIKSCLYQVQALHVSQVLHLYLGCILQDAMKYYGLLQLPMTGFASSLSHLLNHDRAFSTFLFLQNSSPTVARMYGSDAFFLRASELFAFCAGLGAILMDSDSSKPLVGQSCRHM